MGDDFKVLAHINDEFKRIYEWFLLSSGDSKSIYWYARDVVGDRWPEGEVRLLESENAEVIYYYARYVYARYTDGDRWEEGEERLLKLEDAGIIYMYARNIIGGRWSEGEERLLELGNAMYIYGYARYVMDGERWPEGEKFLLSSGNARSIYLYARDVVGERWVRAEGVLRGSDYWGKYKDLVGAGA